MEVTDRSVYPVRHGDRRCRTCGHVHDCYPTRDGGSSWASREDAHVYDPEPWHVVAARYGYTRSYERKRAGVI